MRGTRAIRFFNLANDLYREGQLKEALNAYDSAVILKPDYTKAYNNRGILIASGMKDYHRAIRDFDMAIKTDQGFSDAYLNRGTAWYCLGATEAACSDWNQARKLGNPKADHLISLHCTPK